MCQDTDKSTNDAARHAKDADTPTATDPAAAAAADKRPPSPLQDASLLSRWFFSWAWPLLKLGKERPLQEEDLPHILPEDSSRYNRDHLLFLHQLANQSQAHSSSLFRQLVCDYLRKTWLAQSLLVISMVARIVQALALRRLLDQFDREDSAQTTSTSSDRASSVRTAYLCAATIAICGSLVFTCKQHQFFRNYRAGMQYRSGTVAVLYQKTLRLPSIASNSSVMFSSSASSSSSSGQLLNLASNDAERFMLASVMGIYLIWGPIEAIAILGVGYSIVGPAFCAGFGLFMMVVLPLQWYLSRVFAKLRQQVARHTDARVNLISQVITGARVVKMNAWELSMQERIRARRKEEMNQIAKATRLKGFNEALYFCSAGIVALLIFVVHVLTGNTLTPGMVFSSLTLINLLQYTMTKMFPFAVMTVSEAQISSKRIQEFLQLPELANIQKDANNDDNHHNTGILQSDSPEYYTDNKPVLSLCHVTCHWNAIANVTNGKKAKSTTTIASSPAVSPPAAAIVALNDINFTFYSGHLYGILGEVGSGKSALLQALVGELPLSSGNIHRRYSSIAYASQDPWIMNGSIRDNIILGMPLQEEWYQTVLKACSLQDDIAHFRHGDATILGDRGVQCSGGQKARIGLARALYRDPEVLLLDDPMSAVDARVGAWIFREVIRGLCVKRGKCVILATHQLGFLENATICLLMENCRVSCRGKIADCISVSHGAELSTPSLIDDGHMDFHEVEEDPLIHDEILSKEEPQDKEHEHCCNDKTDAGSGKHEKTDHEHREDRNTGVVKLSAWIEYGQAMGGIWVVILIFATFVLSQASSLANMAMLGKWAEQDATKQDSATSLSIIIGLTAITVFIAIDRAVLSFHFFSKASQRLHDRMTRSVLFAKISFFDTNSSGRLLNRFSADMGIVDEQLPLSMFDCLVGLFMAFGSVATTIAVLPVVIAVLPPLLWYFVSMRQIFVATTRELKRLEGLGRSPIFEMMGEALAGISTIRTNGSLRYFQRKFESIHDAHTRAFFAFVSSSRWFATRLEFVTFLLMTIATFCSAVLYDKGWINIDPAALGLALSLLLQLAGTNFPWIVRQSAEVVNQMVSVERVCAFGSLPSEAPTSTDSDAIHKSWPKAPSISIDGLTVRYRESLPPALSGVTITIAPGQRIGIVGRTGSGKSTLVQALFRLLEADEGAVYIDGVDISTLGLHKLRSAMSVIPQTPVLFRGCSVRENLDPFSSFSNDQIWKVLDDVEMTNVVKDLAGGLHAVVSEGGSNFSVGQRQLLCLARALLSENSILILDEASANVDSKTEASLSNTLSNNFPDATVIAIAHRLDTVKDFDCIIVLGDGMVLEYGSPEDLLKLKNGHYASLVGSQRYFDDVLPSTTYDRG